MTIEEKIVEENRIDQPAGIHVAGWIVAKLITRANHTLLSLSESERQPILDAQDVLYDKLADLINEEPRQGVGIVLALGRVLLDINGTCEALKRNAPPRVQ